MPSRLALLDSIAFVASHPYQLFLFHRGGISDRDVQLSLSCGSRFSDGNMWRADCFILFISFESGFFCTNVV